MSYAMAVGMMGGIGADWLADSLLRKGYGLASGQRAVRRWALVLLSIGLAVSLQAQHGLGWAFATRWACAVLLLIIAAIDLEHRLVPNVLLGAGSVLAFLSQLFVLRWGLLSVLAGAAVGGGLFLLIALLRRGAMGWGDVKLAALIGMITGFPGVLQALVVGILLGGVAAALLLLIRLRQPKQYMPYAPYLVAGCLATLLYGPPIAAWYSSFVRAGG